MSAICYKSQLTRCGAKWAKALAPAKARTQASLCCSIFNAPGVFLKKKNKNKTLMYGVTDHIYKAPKVAYADHTIQYKNCDNKCDSFHFTGPRGKIAHPESRRWTSCCSQGLGGEARAELFHHPGCLGGPSTLVYFT